MALTLTPTPATSPRTRLTAGLFETDYTYYAKLALWLVSLFGTALSLSLGYLGTGLGSAGRLLGAAVMGIFWQQLAGLGHDLGHSGVSDR